MNSLEKQTQWSFAFPSTLCLNPSLKKHLKAFPTNKTDFSIICLNARQSFEAGCDKANKWKRFIHKRFVTRGHIKTTAWKTNNYMSTVAFQKTSACNQVHCILEKKTKHAGILHLKDVFTEFCLWNSADCFWVQAPVRRSDTKCKESFGLISRSQMLCAKLISGAKLKSHYLLFHPLANGSGVAEQYRRHLCLATVNTCALIRECARCNLCLPFCLGVLKKKKGPEVFVDHKELSVIKRGQERRIKMWRKSRLPWAKNRPLLRSILP